MNIPDLIRPGAPVLIVGDYAGADDIWKQRPLGGKLGELFERLLAEAGLLDSECSYTLAFRHRPDADDEENLLYDKKTKGLAKGFVALGNKRYGPPSMLIEKAELHSRIEALQPKVIIALGNVALWALTGEISVNNWRGSLIQHGNAIVIPVHHPRMIQKVWEWKSFAVRDLQRARDYLAKPELYQPPPYQFQIRPTFYDTIRTLSRLYALAEKRKIHIACDLETIARHISVIGIAWSAHEALVIPLMKEEAVPYWTELEELTVMLAVRKLLTHPNCRVSGQNFAYDAQYFAKYHGYVPNLQLDTMLMQHTLFPGMPKDLAMLSSLYCHHHLYWKDELDDFNRMPADLVKYWEYNGKDCCKTWEIAEVLEPLLAHENLTEQYLFLLRMWSRVLRCMLRGVRINQKARSEVAGELMLALSEREAAIHQIVGWDINVGSPVQMQKLFYTELDMPIQRNKKTKAISCDDDSLQKIAKHEPLLKPLIDLISEKRSLGVFLSTFCLMPLDSDKRMRTMYNVAGAETFRFTSAENAFGNGGNLQNIPKGDEA